MKEINMVEGIEIWLIQFKLSWSWLWEWISTEIEWIKHWSKPITTLIMLSIFYLNGRCKSNLESVKEDKPNKSMMSSRVGRVRTTSIKIWAKHIWILMENSVKSSKKLRKLPKSLKMNSWIQSRKLNKSALNGL